MRPAALLLPLALGLAACSALPRAAADRPNLVILLADDLGYGDLGCFGSKTIRTPNLDRMAAEGTRFSSYYAAACVCSPSRAGLLTGRYPMRSGLNVVLFPGSKDGIPDDEVTLAEVLKTQGYATACVGKWHLGHLTPYHPNRHGFDHYFGILYSNDMNPGSPLYRNAEAVETPPVDQAALTKRYTEEAVAFLEAHRDGPFLLYVPYTMPHTPLHASERFLGRSAGGLYGDVVEELDWGVGEIRSALKRLGLEKNTLVVFSSDNGPWLAKKEHGGSAGTLRAGKGSAFEGGFRVPCLAAWPGKVPAGRVSDDPWNALDLFTTAAALAGAAIPGDRPIDGRDVSPLLLGGRVGGEFVFFYNKDAHYQALRVGKWKLHVARFGKRGEGPGTLEKPELYDLEADVGETKNLAAEHPEVLARLRKVLEDFRAGFTAPPTLK